MLCGRQCCLSNCSIICKASRQTTTLHRPKAEGDKSMKYRNYPSHRPVKFRPFVLETTGAFGKEANEFLTFVAQQRRNTNSCISSRTAEMDHWCFKQECAILLQRQNYRMYDWFVKINQRRRSQHRAQLTNQL